MSTISISELDALYTRNRGHMDCEKICFSGVDGYDVYNITAPFEDGGKSMIAGRVEKRDSEDSTVVFFEERDNVWVPVARAPRLHLQDPFVTRIGSDLIVGGVETYPHPTIKNALGYRTAFLKGKDIYNLERFAQGPEMMKDIRLVQLPDGKIGIFTRPSGGKYGMGKIGFRSVASVAGINPEVIASAQLIDNFFADGEWGGVNELHLLETGRIAALGHIARYDENQNRHYHAITFLYDYKMNQVSGVKIIVMRRDILGGPSKSSDLSDVVFSGGIVRKPGGRAEVYLGAGDVEAQEVVIDDPFLAYEPLKD